MPDFSYQVIDARGRERAGRIAGEDKDTAHAALTRRGLVVLRLDLVTRDATGQAPAGRWRRGRKRMSLKQLSLFTRQLATLTQVSPIEESLRTLTSQSEQPHVRAAVARVHQSVVEGRRLADAMAAEPRSFPPLYRAMIAAGENSGSLPVIMARLSLLLERQAAMRAKVLTAIAYPAMLFLFAICVVVALMTLVVPRVVEQFDTVGQRLPLLTRMVIGLSDFLVNWWWLLALVLLGIGVTGWRVLRQEGPRTAFDGAILRVPFFGRLLRDLHAARMARTLATILGSRLPVMEGLALTAQTVHNRALRHATAGIVEMIRAGGSLSAAMRRAGVFPPLLVYLAASGESAGRLDEMLDRAADHLESEFDTFTAAALALLEPAIIIVMGALVAVIILAILLPILQLQSMTGI